MLPICRKNHSEKSFNDLVIKDALKDTIVECSPDHHRYQ